MGVNPNRAASLRVTVITTWPSITSLAAASSRRLHLRRARATARGSWPPSAIRASAEFGQDDDRSSPHAQSRGTADATLGTGYLLRDRDRRFGSSDRAGLAGLRAGRPRAPRRSAATSRRSAIQDLDHDDARAFFSTGRARPSTRASLASSSSTRRISSASSPRSGQPRQLFNHGGNPETVDPPGHPLR